MKKIFIIGFLLSISLFLPTSSLLALTVSPAKIEITGDPGKTINGEFELFNEQQDVKTFYSSFENFEPSGESGTPHFIGTEDGLATWITTGAQSILKSGERKKIPFSISIPQNAEPGGHFAAIFWGTQQVSGKGGGQVSIGGKLGILVLLTVSGQVEEGGGLLEFGGKDGKKFFSSLPIYFNYRFNNTGGNRVVPRGEVAIKNTFWFTSATFLANEKEGSALQGSTRKFETVWQYSKQDLSEKTSGFFGTALQQLTHFHLGWYTAHLDLVWGSDNQTANAKYHFFIVPWQLLIIASILLAVGIFLGTFGIKKYNKWIISKVTR